MRISDEYWDSAFGELRTPADIEFEKRYEIMEKIKADLQEKKA